MGDMANHRAYTRHELDIAEYADTDSTLIADISEGGICFLSPDPMDLGATINIDLNDRQVWLVVLRCEGVESPYRIRCRFSSASTLADITLLIELLEPAGANSSSDSVRLFYW